MKNVLFYLGHPAQYHFIKNTVARLKCDGNKVLILIKTKDILEDLLKEDGVDYLNIQSQPRGDGKAAILKASLQRAREVLRQAKAFQADVLVGTDSSVAQAGWFMRKPAITVLEDDYDVIRNLAKLTFPFSEFSINNSLPNNSTLSLISQKIPFVLIYLILKPSSIISAISSGN